MTNTPALEAAVVGVHMAARALDDFCDEAMTIKCCCTDEGRAEGTYCVACDYEDLADDARHELYILRGVISWLESRLAPLPKPLLHFVKVMERKPVSWKAADDLIDAILYTAAHSEVVEDDADQVTDQAAAAEFDCESNLDADPDPKPVPSSAPPLPSSDRFTLDGTITIDGPAFQLPLPAPSAN